MTDRERIAELGAERDRLREALEMFCGNVGTQEASSFIKTRFPATWAEGNAALSGGGEHEHPDTGRIRHPAECRKATHNTEGGYMHAEGDDGPFIDALPEEVCGICGARLDGYTAHWLCRDCEADACVDCIIPGSEDEQTHEATGKALCVDCGEVERG